MSGANLKCRQDQEKNHHLHLSVNEIHSLQALISSVMVEL